MASNTKYTRASQRDSLDDPAHYSQAPPSYAEPSTSADNDALLGGGPRSSEDNIPDDFKVYKILELSSYSIYSNKSIVWRFCRRSNYRDSNAGMESSIPNSLNVLISNNLLVCPKGLCHPVSIAQLY